MAFAVPYTASSPGAGLRVLGSSSCRAVYQDARFRRCSAGRALGGRSASLRGLSVNVGPPLTPAAERAHPSWRAVTTAAMVAPGGMPKRNVLALLSTIVGVLVLIGSVLYKIPQVVRIARRRSGKGVSVTMYSLETIGTTFSAMYFARKAFAFSSYGELVFVMVQNMVILGLLVVFEKLNRPASVALGILYVALVFLLLSPSVPLRALMVLQIAAIPILNLARVPQILLNWRRKGTGELAPITLGLQLLGNVARIFTTIASVRDWLMLTGVCVSTLFNATLVIQWLYYNNRTQPVALISTSES
jgi:mannose-P-dolichol utilization defect 1